MYPLTYRLVLSTSLPWVGETTTSAHGSLAPGGFCCPSHPRYYDPIRQSRRLPRTSQVHWLYRRSVPDDLVWAVFETFPALSQRSFLACHRPYAERRNEDTPAVSPLPEAFRNKTVRQLLHPTRPQLPSGICLRRCSVHFMLRPVRLLALLGWSDLEIISGRRGRIHPSLPEAGHPNPESGMTTPPFWGRTMTGLAPAGALPLQAARKVANLSDKSQLHHSINPDVPLPLTILSTVALLPSVCTVALRTTLGLCKLPQPTPPRRQRSRERKPFPLYRVPPWPQPQAV